MDWMMQWTTGEIAEMLTNVVNMMGNIVDLNVQAQLPLAEENESLVTKIPGLINDHVLGLSDYLMNFGIKHANTMTRVGRALGAVFAIIVAGKEAYKVMAEQKGFDILDILRPILFAFVLAFWGPIVNTVIAPGHAVESHCKKMYNVANVRMDSLRQLRWEKSKTLGDVIREQRAAVSQQQNAEKQGGNFFQQVGQFLSDGWEKTKNFFKETYYTYAATIETAIRDVFEHVIMWIGELCYTVAIYIVFIIKALFITVLAMFGPIYMAASILPAWKDAWKQWIERIVNASFYGAMAYLAMAFSVQLICYNLETDIKILNDIMNSGAPLGTYMIGGLGSVCTTAVTYFVGCFAMKAVPEMASMCFPGSASHAASHFVGGMQSTAKAAAMVPVKAAEKAAKGGA